MVVLDEDFGTGLTRVEGNGGVRLSPVSVPERAPRDWRSQCERDRARAEAEALRKSCAGHEVASRSDAARWKSRFKACRHRLSEAVEETKEARRVARDVPSFRSKWRPGDAPVRSRRRVERLTARSRRCARRTPGCARPWRHRRPVRARSAGGAQRPVDGAPPWSGLPDHEGHHQDAAQGDHPAQHEAGRRDKQVLQLIANASTGSSRGRSASGGPLGSCPART